MGRQKRAARNARAVSPLAGRLVAWRRAHGLSQSAAAQLLRTTGNTWARWERGHTWPNQGWRERIVALLEGAPAGARGLVAGEYRRFRQDHGLSVAEAAQRVGVTPRAWYAWEAGQYGPRRARRLFRLMDRLDAKAGFLERERPYP